MLYLICLYSEYRIPSEHLGFEYLAAALKQENFPFLIIDQTIEGISSEEIVEKLLKDNNACCAFSMDENNYLTTIDFSRNLLQKKSSIKLACGGTLVTTNYNAIESLNLFDLVVRGGNETKITTYLTNLEQGKKPNKSLTVNCLGTVVSLVPDRSYYLNFIKEKGFARVLFSRGCSYRCSFCLVNAIEPDGVSYLNGSIRQDLDYLYSEGIKDFLLTDNSFLGYSSNKAIIKDRLDFVVEQLCHYPDINFRVSMRPEHANNTNLTTLKDLGLVAVSIGVESAHPSQRKRYIKHGNLQMLEECLGSIQKVEIGACAYIIPFDPLVTLDEIRTNFAFMSRHSSKLIEFSSASLGVAIYQSSIYYRQHISKIKSFNLAEELTGRVAYHFNNPEVEEFYLEIAELRHEEALKYGLARLNL